MEAPSSGDNRTPKEKVQFYVSAALLISAIFSLSAFLFLIPFVLDPAYALISAKFVKDPVTCQVVDVETTYGVTNCSAWSSCREGCTREMAECTRILVRYTSKLAEDQVTEHTEDSVWESEGPARFFINVKGCGYPPVVNCSLFASYYGTEGEVFPCYYSTVNPHMVIPGYDLEEAHEDMVYATVFPVTIFTIGVTGLCLMYIRVCRERALAMLNSAGFNLIAFLDSFELKPEPDENQDGSDEEPEEQPKHVAPQPHLPSNASNAAVFPGADRYGHGARKNLEAARKGGVSKALITSIHTPIMNAAGTSMGSGHDQGGGKPKRK